MAGFEDQLVGLKENDEKKFSLIFPTDFLAKDLAGQLVDFEVKIKLVQEPQPPALDDSFARAVGQFDDLAALKKNIGEGLIIEKRQKEKETWRVKVLRSIVEKSTMDLPPVLLEAELEKTLAEFKDSLVQMGLNFEEYLAKIKKTPEELRQNWQPKARERAATALVLDAIARQENIQVSSQEAEEDVNKIISRYPDWDAVKAQIDMEQLLAYAKGRLKNEKVFEWLENFK